MRALLGGCPINVLDLYVLYAFLLLVILCLKLLIQVIVTRIQKEPISVTRQRLVQVHLMLGGLGLLRKLLLLTERDILERIGCSLLIEILIAA